MQCPACGSELVAHEFNGVKIDVCDGGCGGVWFEWSSVKTLTAPPQIVDSPLEIARNTSIKLDPSRRLKCPNCTNIAMARDYSPVLEDVLLDECHSCGGVWLSGDEVSDIHYSLGELIVPGPKAKAPQREMCIAYALQVLCTDACAV